ncbi:KR domain-containing protein, partial [Paenibacillus sp. OT2-17]|uniref:polyketide synthase dehydratase domain-containing protein n=1 Tax=Paenibacillus sp. OT2-17 TaxID=2691605 RepID=UPI00135419EE
VWGMGADYSSGHQANEQVHIGQGLVLAKLSLPSGIRNTEGLFVLHPFIINAALQMPPAYLFSNDENIMRPSGIDPLQKIRPTAIERLEIFRECPCEMWALIRYSRGSGAGHNTQKYDIDLCDEGGQVCVRIKGCSYKVGGACEKTPGVMLLQPFWKEQAVAEDTMVPTYERHVVMLCETDTIAAGDIEFSLAGMECITLQSGMEEVDRRFEKYAVQVFEKIKSILNDKPKGKVLVQIVTMPQHEKLLFAGLCGILKTAQKENPKIHGQLIEVEDTEKMEGLIEILKTSSRHPADSRIRFAEGKRWIPVWSKAEMPSETPDIPWKDRGVYLITGGAKGLGLIFAKEIARQAKEVTLILTGRSLLDQDKQTSLEELK